MEGVLPVADFIERCGILRAHTSVILIRTSTTRPRVFSVAWPAARRFLRWVAFFSCIGIASAGPAWAQQRAPTGFVLVPVELKGPLWVSLSGRDLSGIDVRAVVRAVATELGLPLAKTREESHCQVQIELDGSGELRVVVSSSEGISRERRVAAPSNILELGELAALVVGNLARDESSNLLLQLAEAEAPADVTETVAAETKTEGVPESSASEGSQSTGWLNLSGFYPVSLLSGIERRKVTVEVGLLYGRIGALGAFSVTPGVTYVAGQSVGLQLAGIGNIHAQAGMGARLAGGFNWGASQFVGLGAAGIVEMHRGQFTGLQLGGAAAIAGEIEGLQLAAGTSVAETIRGLQMAIVNIGGSVTGVQLGLINIAREVKGAQLGLVNVAGRLEGASVAPVAYTGNGRTQAVAWYSTSMAFNLGVRFQTGGVYVMPTVGYDSSRSFNVLPGLSLGLHIPLGSLFLDIESNSSIVTGTRLADWNSSDMRYRGLVGLALTDTLKVFAGGGVWHHFETEKDRETLLPEFSVGVQGF